MNFPQDIPFNQLPTVTVLIANWNYGKYLPGCINSALSQTYPKTNIVIIDDDSKDGSWNIINDLFFKTDYSKLYLPNMTINKIKYGDINVTGIKIDNHVGVSAARNIAIEQTINETNYFQILDADDEMLPEKVNQLAGTMFMSPGIGVTYADYNILNLMTNTLLTEYKEPFDRNRLLQECIVHSGAMIRKEALLKTKDQFGYYNQNQRCAEDYDLWLRISEKFMICHVPSILSIVRVHQNNSTYSVNKEIWQRDWEIVRQRLIERNQK